MKKVSKKRSKRLDNSYKNYVKRYKAKEKMLEKKGYQMASKMMSKKMYKAARDEHIRKGVTININQTIVSDQAYEYSQKTARRFKATAEKFGLDWKDKKITELRKGVVDVSGINNALKEMSDEEREELFALLPEGVKHTNQGYISYYVFGSE